MKILILDTYYDNFLRDFYAKNKIGGLDFKRQRRMLMDGFYAQSDSYSHYLKVLGVDAQELVINDELLQRKWAKENGIEVNGRGLLTKLQMMPLVWRVFGKPSWVQTIALAQVKKYKPDIIYMQNLSILNPDVLASIGKRSLLVGQIAYQLPPEKYLKHYNLILTSFPHFVNRLKKMGIKSEYFKIGFDPRVLRRLSKQKKKYDVTFIGAFTPQHSKGTKLLEKIAKKVPIHVWGRGTEFLSPTSPLRKNLHSEFACGLYMYKILAQSRIVLNRHINVAEDYANNMRLYEVTGVGTMLLTDRKKNMNSLFEVGKEVVDYKGAKDAIKKIKYFLTHDSERKKISLAGQRRTLVDHSYSVRMRKLHKILKSLLED